LFLKLSFGIKAFQKHGFVLVAQTPPEASDASLFLLPNGGLGALD
jgi:hypothetical protein